MAARWASHEGVHHFTVGQRKGLGIAAAEPLYVIATDPQTQRVVVGSNDGLLRARCFVKDVNWISIAGVDGARARAGEDPQQARRRRRRRCSHGRRRRVEVVFDEPQRAVTPGQGAVFYDGDVVLGGGWIE